jgi:hypothetical protein
MRVIPFIIGISLLTLSGCVSKSDYEKLEKEKSELANQLEATKQELSGISYKYKLLNEEKQQAEIERNKTPYISEDQALQYIKDNYAFYEKDESYRNVQLRRISDNSFRVSLETCTKKGPFSDSEFFWRSSVRTLTVHKSGKYDF